MKQALLLSDSHGQNEEMMAVIEHFSEVDAIFHMGDIGTAKSLIESKARCLTYVVRGNTDRDFDLPETVAIDFAGKRILATHGHHYVDYGGYDTLRYFGEENQADVVLFGHIHRPVLAEYPSGTTESGTMLICNPGSISRPRQYDGFKTFAVLTVEDDGEMWIRHYTCDISTLGLPIIDEYEIESD